MKTANIPMYGNSALSV